jgi:hypothetical protein
MDVTGIFISISLSGELSWPVLRVELTLPSYVFPKMYIISPHGDSILRGQAK